VTCLMVSADTAFSLQQHVQIVIKNSASSERVSQTSKRYASQYSRAAKLSRPTPFLHTSATPAPISFPSASRISHSTHSLGLCDLSLAVVKAGEPLFTPALPTEVMVCYGRESDIGGVCLRLTSLLVEYGITSILLVRRIKQRVCIVCIQSRYGSTLPRYSYRPGECDSISDAGEVGNLGRVCRLR